MHEELKQATGNNGGFNESMRSEFERVQRENNTLHQQMITVKEDAASKISKMNVQIKTLESKVYEQEVRDSQNQGKIG